MADFDLERQPLEEAIYDYRKKHQGPPPDFDAKFVLDILRQVNDSSNIRIAIDPIDYADRWRREAKFFGITGCYISDDSKLIFRVHRDKATLTADELFDRITKAMKHRPSKHIPIGFEYGDEIHKLTDMYGHSLVNDMWAGLPFDVVMAEVTPEAKTPPVEEEASE